MSEWKILSVPEFAEIISGSTPATNVGEYWDGDIEWVTPVDLSKLHSRYLKSTIRKISKSGLGNSSTGLIPANNVVMSSRAPIGYFAIPTNDFTTNQGCKSFKFYPQQDAEFHYYNFLLNIDYFKRFGSGSTFAEISKTDIEKLSFNIPTSLPEQRKIACILSTVDAVIEKTEAAIAKYKAIKSGMMRDLFTRGIDLKTGKLRPRYEDAPDLYKQSELGWVPRDWEVVVFGDHIELVHGHQFRDYDFTEFGVAVVKIGQVKPENIDLSNCSFVADNRREEFRNETIKNGDVLMALTGATLGKACLVSSLSSPVLQNYRVGRFEPKIIRNGISKSFLYYSLIAGDLLDQIYNKVNSGAQGNIGKADFEKAIMLKPSFVEQNEIANKLIVFDRKIHAEVIFAEKHQQLKAALMSDLLTGKVRVEYEKETAEAQ